MKNITEVFISILLILSIGFTLGWFLSKDFYNDINEKVEEESKLMDYCYQQKKYDCWKKTNWWPTEELLECMDPVGYDCTVGGQQEEYRDEWMEYEKVIKEYLETDL